MKKIKAIVFPMVIISSFFVWKLLSFKNKQHEQEVCVTKDASLNGVITAKGGHGVYTWIEVSNKDESLKLNISKTIYKKGFNANYVYSVGDSIYKKQGSKQFTIKRGESLAIYLLDCKE